MISCDVTDKGSAIFSWLTEVTHFESPVSKDRKIPKYATHLPGETDYEKDFTIIPDPSKTYTLQVEIVDLVKWVETYPSKDEITMADLKEVLNLAAIRVWSTSPSFHWQGMNANISKLDGSIHPTDIEPKYWNQPFLHGDVYFLDKHLAGLINAMPFFLNPMASMLTRTLRKAGVLPTKP